MIVRELLTRLGFKVDETGAKQYEKRMDGVKRHAATLQRNLGGILGTIGVGMGFAFFKDVTSQFTDLESRLANQSGIDDAGVALKRLNEVALLTYQGTQQVVEGFLSMKSGLDAMGMSVEDQVLLQQSIADGFTATGVKGEYAARAMMWLNRAFMKGKVGAEELNGLLENSDDLLQQFAEWAGAKNVQALKDMAKQGKVTSEMMIRFFQQSTDRFREQSESMPVTINDALTRIQERFKFFVYEQDKATGASAFMAQMLLKVADNIEVLAGVVGALMIPALMGITVWVASTTAAFVGLAAALLANPITWIILLLAGLALAIEDVYQWITGGKSLIGDWLGPWEDVVSKAKQVWQDFVTWLSDSWNAFREAGAAAIDGTLSAIYGAIESAIKDPWGTLWRISLPGIMMAVLPTLFEPLKGAFQAVMDWFSEKWSAFWDTASHPIRTLRDWWNNRAKAPTAAAPQPGAWGSLPPRASGGPVSRGKAYMVGEEGPEPFIPRSSGWILPHGLGKMMAGLGGLSAPRDSSTSVRIGDISVNVDVQLPIGGDRDGGRSMGNEVANRVRDELRKVISSTLSSFPETV